MTTSIFSQDEEQQIKVLMDPVLWAKAVIDWTARDYQEGILRDTVKKALNVYRLGRRLGKTEMLCILCLWYAFTQYNKRTIVSVSDDKFSILIVTPGDEQIKLIFKRLRELIAASPILQSVVSRDVENQIEFTNGSIIKGMTAASKSSSGAQNVRGQGADLLILDEADYMLRIDLDNLIHIRDEDPARIRVIASSTPTGKRDLYYDWCTKAPGNGWIEHYAPSTVNKKLMEINPDTGKTYIEEYREQYSLSNFQHEIMAEFGEEEGGVYRKVDLDAAIKLGKEIGLEYTWKKFDRNGPRVLGVDWDKTQAGVSLCSVEWNQKIMKFVPFHAEEVERSEFTLQVAVDKIIVLDKVFNYDYMVIDRGYGEYQIERIKTLLEEFSPGEHKSDKVVAITLSDNISVPDPMGRGVHTEPIKPWMINQSQMQFERKNIALNPHDSRLIKQLQDYRVVNISPTGRPTYTKKNEHFVDALNFAIYGLVMKSGVSDIAKYKVSNMLVGMSKPFGSRAEPLSRSIENDKEKLKVGIGVFAVKNKQRANTRGGGLGVPSRVF